MTQGRRRDLTYDIEENKPTQLLEEENTCEMKAVPEKVVCPQEKKLTSLLWRPSLSLPVVTVGERKAE